MVWGVVAQVAGGLLQGNQAGKAAAAETGANERALLLNKAQADQARADNMPVLQARDAALNELLAELGLQGFDQGSIDRTREQNRIDSEIAQLESRIPAIQANNRSPVPDTFHQLADIDPLTRLAVRPATNKLRGANYDGSGSDDEKAIQQQIADLRAQRESLGSAPATPMDAQPRPQQQLTQGDQFLLDEAIKSAQIAAGGQMGGNALRGLQERSVGFLSGIRENRLNRLQDLAFGTQTAVGNNNALQVNAATSQGQFAANAGAARGSGFINQSNALTGTLQNLNNTFQNNQGRNQLNAFNNTAVQNNQSTAQIPSPF